MLGDPEVIRVGGSGRLSGCLWFLFTCLFWVPFAMVILFGLVSEEDLSTSELLFLLFFAAWSFFFILLGLIRNSIVLDRRRGNAVPVLWEIP